MISADDNRAPRLALCALALLALSCGGKKNHAPTANGQIVNTTSQALTPITLTASDPDGDALTFIIDTQPSNGTLDATNPPDVVYQSGGSFTGVDSFTFHVNDGALDSDVATIWIGVDNTAPTTSGFSDSTNEDTALPLTLPGNDVDGDTLYWVIDMQPSNGTLSGTAPDLTYTPDQDYFGGDSFTFHVTDGAASSSTETVDITVDPVNDPPVSQDLNVQVVMNTPTSVTLQAMDVDDASLSYEVVGGPTHGSLSGTPPDLTYDPDTDYTGPDSFTYRAHDTHEYGNTATVSINVVFPPGRVWAWGSNSNGQLGNNSTGEEHTAVLVQGVDGVVQVSGGETHSLALKDDGTVWAWGNNGSGRLGDNSTQQRLTPVQVHVITDVQAVSAGGSHSLALKDNGTVWAWGANGSGQLGDGSNSTRLEPVQVQGLTGVTAIAAGQAHSVARKSDGTVWCWGANGSGQLGIGAVGSKNLPQKVGSLGSVVLTATGYSHTLAVNGGGTGYAWGENSAGQLGDLTTSTSYYPVQILWTGSITAIDGGEEHTIARIASGQVMGWGNNVGALSAAMAAKRSPVPPQHTYLAISAGGKHSMLMREDKTVWCWGVNDNGQLGDNTTAYRDQPVQAQGLPGIKAIGGGGSHSLAVQE